MEPYRSNWNNFCSRMWNRVSTRWKNTPFFSSWFPENRKENRKESEQNKKTDWFQPWY